MSKYCRDVQLFQNKFGFSVPSDFIFIPQDLFDFRVKFFHEELNEYIDSCTNKDLGTAVDSLIDLVYITCGTAIYHGVGYDKFDAMIDPVVGSPDLIKVKLDSTGNPHFLDAEANREAISTLTRNIQEYVDAYAAKSEKGIRRALAALYLNCMFISTQMDLTTEQWDEMWNDVQRANMSKERALSKDQSKRGSTYDIIKPAGWIPPRTEELIQKYLSDAGCV